MDAKDTDIFISYRRIDGRDIARTIQLALGKEGFENVFFDYKSMREGKFNEQILTAINHCKDFILVLSPQSMQRCSTPGDWVAKEIQAAIEAGCKIIPVQINDPFTNWPKDFPRQFNFIKQIEFLTLRTDEYFSASIDRLVGWLDTKPKKDFQETEKFISITVTSDETCEFYIDGKKSRRIKSNKQAYINDGIKKGKTYKLRFESLARKGSFIEFDYCAKEETGEGNNVTVSFAERRNCDLQKAKENRLLRKKEKEETRFTEGMLMQAAQLYEDTSFTSDGMTAVCKKGKYGFLDENCFESVPCIYDDVSCFCNGFATVCKNEKWGIIDHIGQIVIPIESECPCWENGAYKYFISSQNGRYAISTIEKGLPTVFPYENIYGIAKYPDLFFVKKDRIWKMINADGGKVPFTLEVDSIVNRWQDSSTFRSSLVRYMGDYKWWEFKVFSTPLHIKNPSTLKIGYLNSKLQLTIPFVDEGSTEKSYEDNLVIIKSNEKMGLADIESGRYIIPPIYNNIHQFYYRDPFPFFRVSEGCTYSSYETDNMGNIYEKNHMLWGGRQGVINSNGDLIVPPQYSHIDFFVHNESIIFLSYIIDDLKLNYDTSNFSNYRGGRTHYLEAEFDKNKTIVHIYSQDGSILKTVPYKKLEDMDLRSLVQGTSK